MDLNYEITCMARSGRPASVPSPAAHPSAGGGRPRFLRRLAKAVLGRDSVANPARLRRQPGRTKTSSHTKSETPGKDQVAMDITPGLNPMADIRFMEVMIGPSAAIRAL